MSWLAFYNKYKLLSRVQILPKVIMKAVSTDIASQILLDFSSNIVMSKGLWFESRQGY